MRTEDTGCLEMGNGTAAEQQPLTSSCDRSQQAASAGRPLAQLDSRVSSCRSTPWMYSPECSCMLMVGRLVSVSTALDLFPLMVVGWTIVVASSDKWRVLAFQ